MEPRTKSQMDQIIAAGTADEINDSAFWQEYAAACATAKNQPAPFVQPPRPIVPPKVTHYLAREACPRDVDGSPIRHRDIHDWLGDGFDEVTEVVS